MSRPVPVALVMGAALIAFGPVQSQSMAPQSIAPSEADAPPFASGHRLAGGELAAVAGRADTAQIIRAQNSGVVSNNSVSGQSQTGSIAFDAQAFQNLNGLSLLSANTGNNVSINASLNVNVAIQR